MRVLGVESGGGGLIYVPYSKHAKLKKKIDYNLIEKYFEYSFASSLYSGIFYFNSVFHSRLTVYI